MLLGVSGGIAAYKAADLVRRLRDAGAEVRVIMTEGACRFVTPLTFQALSGHPVRTELFDPAAEAAMGHIELARWAELYLIAPASADVIARLAAGLANDLLTTVAVATRAPLFLAPAMNREMWAHAATTDNVERLRARGAVILGPGVGDQACGEVGPGRMLEPTEIVAGLIAAQAPGVLEGVRVLVSAGPTFEDIDPVRFIGNRSSGRMGFAVAEAARAAGAVVTLVAGPVHLDTPTGVSRVNVRSAAEMHRAVVTAAREADIYIASAAVADYRPAEIQPAKIKKADAPRALPLVPTTDILAELGASAEKPFLVGFAAETNDVEHYARDKLARKRLDMIVANRVGQAGCGFEADENELVVIAADERVALGRGGKRALADALIEIVARRFRAKTVPGRQA